MSGTDLGAKREVLKKQFFLVVESLTGEEIELGGKLRPFCRSSSQDRNCDPIFRSIFRIAVDGFVCLKSKNDDEFLWKSGSSYLNGTFI